MDGFFGIGLPELFMIAVIALIVLGPERLPGTIREVVKFIRQVRAMGSDLMGQFGDEFKDLQDLDPRRIISEMTDPLKLDDKGKAIAAKPATPKPITPTPAKNTTATTNSTTPKPVVTTSSSNVAKPTTSTPTPAVANTTPAASTNGAVAGATATASAINGNSSASEPKVKPNSNGTATEAKEPLSVQPSNTETPVENTIAPPRPKPAVVKKPATISQPTADPSAQPVQLIADSAINPPQVAEAKPKAKRTRKPKAKAETVVVDPATEENVA